MSERQLQPPQYGQEYASQHPWGAEYSEAAQRSGRPPEWSGEQPEWHYLDGRSAESFPRDNFDAMRTRRTRRRFPRGPAIVVFAVCVGVVAAAVLIGRGGAGARPAAASHQTPSAATGDSSGIPPVITRAQAQQVLAHYVGANNLANRVRSDAQLASIEGRTSYQMDTGAYRWLAVTDPTNLDYAPTTLKDPVFYIPRMPGYPRWWAVRVTTVSLSSRPAPTPGYLIFSQNSPGGSWKNVLEPNTFAGSGPAPQIATDAQGYAIATTSSTARLSITPGEIQAITAASLDRTASTIRGPGNLSDQSDEAYWRSRLQPGETDTDTHSATPAGLAGLRTVGGGALLFYALTAHLTLTAPSGQAMNIQIPGYYSATQLTKTARVGYTEQFATYDPPGRGSPRVIADSSGIDSRG
jgi:hypothetical protein